MDDIKEIRARITADASLRASLTPDATLHARINNAQGGGGTYDYNELDNKPSLNGHELVGNTTLDDIDVYDKTFIASAFLAYTEELDKKAYMDYVVAQDAALSGRIDAISGGMEAKADKTYVDEQDMIISAEVAKKATKDYVDLQDDALMVKVDTKADKSYVDNADSALNEGKQNKADPTLTTSDKTIVGAINELKDTKQATLQSGVNIKTINNLSLLGSGNITIEGGGGTSDYDQLSNRPQINSVTLTGNKQLSDLGIPSLFDIPTKVSQLQNDSGFVTEDYHDDTKQNKEDMTLETEATTIVGAINENRANLVQEGQTRAEADNLIWQDLDTKVTSIPAQEGNPFVYGRMNTEAGGTEGKFTMSADVLTGAVVKRNGDSSILVRSSPTRDNEAIGKAYADLAAQQVKQTQATNNLYFPLLHKVNSDSAERTAQVYFNTKVAMNPSLGDVKATSFTENGTSLANKYALKTSIPTATSQLTNDSGFLTLDTLPRYNGEVE